MTGLAVSIVLGATAAIISHDVQASARHAERTDRDGIFIGDHLTAARENGLLPQS